MTSQANGKALLGLFTDSIVPIYRLYWAYLQTLLACLFTDSIGIYRLYCAYLQTLLVFTDSIGVSIFRLYCAYLQTLLGCLFTDSILWLSSILGLPLRTVLSGSFVGSSLLLYGSLFGVWKDINTQSLRFYSIINFVLSFNFVSISCTLYFIYLYYILLFFTF